ncbi:nucleotidyltransferase domain-containing protein [Candidatus Margulisiibacteriota bacterium]
MRLNNKEIVSIKETVLEYDPEALIYLFGSRVDPQKKGGDIDLLVLSQKLTEKDKTKIRLGLFDKLGEQKIDLIIAKDLKKPFVRIAHDQGVLL